MNIVPFVMRAQLLTGHGGLDKLEYREDVPVPQPGPGEVLIRVCACGMNNTDINTRTAWYSPKVRAATSEGGADGFAEVKDGDGSWGRSGIGFPRIQGADVAGEVAALGAGAPKNLPGKRVMIDPWLRDWDNPDNIEKARYFGSEADGGYADYCTAPAQNVHAVESVLSDVELATFSTSYITAENMLVRAHVGEGDIILVPGASGGVGSALIQLARRRGARVIAMAGAAKRSQVAALGAEAVLDREPADLRAALKSATGVEAVDVVADVVGGPMFNQFIQVLRKGGRYTCAGAIAGPVVELDLRTFYLNNLVFTGATVIPPGLFADLVRYIERGEIKPLAAATYPLKDLRQAQEAFLAKKHVGNIVIDHSLA
ncbi:MAG: alcohol dehydrogenase family protein [Rhodospirillales bacterium]